MKVLKNSITILSNLIFKAINTNPEGLGAFHPQESEGTKVKTEVKEVVQPEIDINRSFSIDLSAFFKNQKRADLKQSILEQYHKKQEHAPDNFKINELIDEEMGWETFEPQEALFNLKQLLKEKKVIEVGNDTLRLVGKGNGLYVSLTHETRTIDMGLMEFLKRLGGGKAFTTTECDELFGDAFKDYARSTS